MYGVVVIDDIVHVVCGPFIFLIFNVQVHVNFVH